MFIDHNSEHVLIRFDEQREVLSSAPLYGGLQMADGIVNRCVTNNDGSIPELEHYIYEQTGSRRMVGLMTAASMKSFRHTRYHTGDISLSALVTCGLGNARRAGDPADESIHIGTINSIIICEMHLTPAALVEAVAMVTEAKAATLQDLAIRSLVSGKIATGTGTDAVAIVNGPTGHHQPSLPWCGKHTHAGYALAHALSTALYNSITDYQ